MNKINKTWVLIIILVILTGILLAISFFSNKIRPTAEVSPTVTFQPEKETAFTTLRISGEPRISTISGVFELDVIIDTNKNEVTMTQLEFAYDPDLLRIFDILPGSFLENPNEIQKNIDEENGRISYWLGVNPNERWVQGNGILATIIFTKLGTQSAQIDFTPKSSVNAFGIDSSVLMNTVPGFIYDLPTMTPAPTRLPTSSPTPEI